MSTGKIRVKHSIRSLNDRWIVITGIPLFSFISTVVFYPDRWLSHSNPFLVCYFVSILVTTIYWLSNRVILLTLRQRYSSVKETRSRVFLQLLFSTVLSVSLSLIISRTFSETNFWNHVYTFKDYIYDAIVVLFFVYTASAIYELNFYFTEWKKSVTETEELKKANLQSQFDMLKNQVNPHFLFNSLNTLSSLIEEDQPAAVRFVDQLSKVYRYLLQTNEKGLCTLKEELEFIQAYFFLLKMRFGEGIQVNFNIPSEYMCRMIPPLTLQMLVENAVKHNVISSSRRLDIEIQIDDMDFITVKNNLQKKTVHVSSNGLGLSNIQAKFRLLNQPPIRILQDDKFFLVSLPLVNTP